jgi:hypothetical protein
MLHKERNLFHMEQYEPTSQTLGKAIKQAYKAVGKTQNDVILETGISRTSFFRKINGGVFGYEELVKVAKACEVKLSELMELAESMQAKINTALVA